MTSVTCQCGHDMTFLVGNSVRAWHCPRCGRVAMESIGENIYKWREPELLDLLDKATSVIDDMRMVDRYNSGVDFDVEDLLKDLLLFRKTEDLCVKS
jgi:hypothetical protein